jgi:isocitrate dehydrogenase
MTKDLSILIGAEQRWMTTVKFLEKIDENFQKAMNA